VSWKEIGFQTDRPWRRVGAGICVVLAVMFVVGVWALEHTERIRHPVLFLIYWLIFLGLVAWLCVLALRDCLYTLKMVSRWRQERNKE
jgi:hypothetical protein